MCFLLERWSWTRRLLHGGRRRPYVGASSSTSVQECGSGAKIEQIRLQYAPPAHQQKDYAQTTWRAQW
jgi:hypothetical protein